MSSISAAAARSTTTAPAATKASSQPAATATSGMTRLPFASRKSATASSTATSTSIHWYLAPPSTTSASSTASRSSLVPTSKTYGGKLGVSALRARNNQPWTTLWSGTYDMPFIPASIRLGEWLWNPRARCDLNNPYDDPRNSSAAAVARSIRLLSMVQNWVSMDFLMSHNLTLKDVCYRNMTIRNPANGKSYTVKVQGAAVSMFGMNGTFVAVPTNEYELDNPPPRWKTIGLDYKSLVEFEIEGIDV
ncbi:hypothetical protein JCM10049v2_007431 [Rhodotorula toruloides]